jgi:hypothetical protein
MEHRIIMKKSLFTLAVSLFAAMLSGCMSYSYEGKTEAPVKAPEYIKIYHDSSKIGKKYTVLGTATVSGYARDVSSNRMLEKLRSEAHKCGACAILIVEQQLVSADSDSEAQPFTTAFDFDDTDRNWRQIYQDIDRNFANTRRVPNAHVNPGAERRIIRAEFVKW